MGLAVDRVDELRQGTEGLARMPGMPFAAV